MKTPALKDKATTPTPEVLASTLQESFAALEAWRETLSGMGIELQWNYYNDGKAWLCKMVLGKKNLGWLIPYEGFFRTNFFFLARHTEAISTADISESLKAQFASKDFSTAKLHPISVRITSREQLAEAMAVLKLKQKLK